MRRVWFLCALPLLLGAICGKKAPHPSDLDEVVVAAQPKDPRAGMKKLLGDAYGAFEKQDVDALEPLFVLDVAALGLGPSDFFSDRPYLIDELRRQLVPLGLKNETLKFTRSAPLIGVAEGNQSAWVYDAPTVELARKGRLSRYWKPRVTAHAVREGEVWKFDALHVSLGFPDAKLYEPGADKKLVAPEDSATEKGRDTEQIIGLTRRMLDDIAVKVNRVSERPEVALVGTDPLDVFLGGKTFKDFAKPKLAELKKAPFSVKLDTGLRSRLAPDGRSGWALGNVVLTLGTGKTAKKLVPFRALWFFVEEKGVWNLAAEHQSLGLKLEQRDPVEAPVDEPPDAGTRRDAGR